MNCPRCGGVDRVEIARGVYECRSRVTQHLLAPRGPGGQLVPDVHVSVCGHRYQDGSGTIDSYCFCGFGAVAKCRRCAAALCYKHVVEKRDAVLCNSCAATVVEEQRRLAEEAVEATVRPAIIDVVAAIEAATDDPVDRVVRLNAALCYLPDDYYRDRAAEICLDVVENTAARMGTRVVSKGDHRNPVILELTPNDLGRWAFKDGDRVTSVPATFRKSLRAGRMKVESYVDVVVLEPGGHNDGDPEHLGRWCNGCCLMRDGLIHELKYYNLNVRASEPDPANIGYPGSEGEPVGLSREKSFQWARYRWDYVATRLKLDFPKIFDITVYNPGDRVRNARRLATKFR